MKKDKTSELLPTMGRDYSIYNAHHVGMLNSGTLEDFKKLKDFSRDEKPIETTERDENGIRQYIVHRKEYTDILTHQEGRNLDLYDVQVLEYLCQLATPLKEKYKEEMKLIISYKEYFSEVRKVGGGTLQKNRLIESLEKLGSHLISFKVLDKNGNIIKGTTPFNMFTADYTKRGRIEVYINPLFNKYFLQRASEKPRSKVIQRMDPKNDATAIYIMRAIDNFIGQNDHIAINGDGHKIWRIKVTALLNEVESLKEAKKTVFDLFEGLPPARAMDTAEPIKNVNNAKHSPIHKIMIPFIKGLNKCTVNYSGTKGLLSWRFVLPGGKALSETQKKEVTPVFNDTDKNTNGNLNFSTFQNMTIELVPFMPANMRPKKERQANREKIIKKNQTINSKKKTQ